MVTGGTKGLGYGIAEGLLEAGCEVEIVGSSNKTMSTAAAGIQRRHSAEDFPIEEWDEVMSINLRSVFIMCQLAGKTMLKQSSGRIINIASMTSFFGSEMIPAYAASKGAVCFIDKRKVDKNE